MKKNKKQTFSNYKKVYGLLYGTYGRNARVRLSFLMSFVSRMCKFVALPIVSSHLIAALTERDYGRAQFMALLFVGFSSIIAVLSPLTKYVSMLGENPTYNRLVRDYFQRLLFKDMRYFNESMAGYITTATRQFSDSTVQLVRALRDQYLRTFYSFFAPIIVIAFVDRVLGVVVFGLSGVQMAYLYWASRKIEPLRTKSREAYKYSSGYISDAVTNILAIKATAQERTVSDVAAGRLAKEQQLFTKRYALQAKLAFYRECITVTFFFSLFWLTIERMRSESLSVSGAILVITYTATLLTAIYELSELLDQHDDYIDKIVPAFDLLEEPNVVSDPQKPHMLKSVKGAVDFSAVTFSYVEKGSEVSVFRSLKLHIPARQKVGIVGLSGAGKSTLAKLLLRFEDVQDGAVTIDGVDIRTVLQQDVRRTIAYVPQEPLLFHDTIANNIRLGNLDADDDRVHKAAHAEHFIEALADEYDSVVGERGVKLSGGQKQRIAIARAVLQDSPIILLDEATSALDSESEQIIKDSFASIFKQKTAIVIAHRLSTLADLDRIVLLHEGEVVEDGTHHELLKKGGVYAKLWNRQRLHPEEVEQSELATLKNG